MPKGNRAPFWRRRRHSVLSLNLEILRHLAGRIYTTAAEIGAACWMNAAEVRARLVMLETARLVAGRPDKDALPGKPQRVFVVTAEGRRKAGISDARSTTSSV